ncbi:MAG: hypothetical protein BZ133_01170 [Methanosphaera sp. SHI613]|jgi:hypothetical protein|nr:MAG: hypothetical protein BZ133_01170 [Methanosphaera sp. SHI613]
MNASKYISDAFNDAVKIDKSWLILALPFIIYYIFNLFDLSVISTVIAIIISILELGVVTRIIQHVLNGNEGLLKGDFNLYNADLIVDGIKSFIRMLIIFVLIFAVYFVMIAMGYSSGSNLTFIIIMLIAAIIMSILFSLSGFVLAHDINTDSFVDGIIKLPSILKSVGIGNFILFMIINLILLVVMGLLIGFLSLIPIIGSIIGNSIISTAFLFYFILASTYLYREYVMENKNEFNENEFNLVLKYPKTSTPQDDHLKSIENNINNQIDE